MHDIVEYRYYLRDTRCRPKDLDYVIARARGACDAHPSRDTIEITSHGGTPMIAESARPRSLAYAWWKEITTVGPDTGGPWPAARVSISVTVPLAAVLAVGNPDWAGYAVFGSLSSVYGKQYGYSDRMRAQLGAGAALTISMLLGTITGIAGPGSIWTVAAMSAMSVLGLLITRCLGWLPVPSLFLVFATGTISSSQHAWGDVVDAFVIAVLAALFGVAIGQIGRLFPGRRPKIITAPRLTPLRDVFGAAGARTQMLQYARRRRYRDRPRPRSPGTGPPFPPPSQSLGRPSKRSSDALPFEFSERPSASGSASSSSRCNLRRGFS